MANEIHPFSSGRWYDYAQNEDLKEKWFIHKSKPDEVISFAYMPNKEIKSIFLGTFPIWEITVGPHGGINKEFFYGSIVNDFWNCLGLIFKMPVESVNDRILILDNFKIGITDILGSVNRNPSNCDGDDCLKALSYNDILIIKEFYPSLKNIFITSGGNGTIGNIKNTKNSATWFKDSVSTKKISGFNTKGFVKKIIIDGIELNLIYLFSPSNAANTSRQGEINRNNSFGVNNLNIAEFRKLQWSYFLKKYHLEDDFNINIDSVYNNVNSNGKLLKYFND